MISWPPSWAHACVDTEGPGSQGFRLMLSCHHLEFFRTFKKILSVSSFCRNSHVARPNRRDHSLPPSYCRLSLRRAPWLSLWNFLKLSEARAVPRLIAPQSGEGSGNSSCVHPGWHQLWTCSLVSKNPPSALIFPALIALAAGWTCRVWDSSYRLSCVLFHYLLHEKLWGYKEKPRS